MVVIYAEKPSLASEIAHALKAGKRKSLKDDPKVGYYEFVFNGEQAVICHGVGHLAQLVPAKFYDEKFSKWDLNVFPCIPENFRKAPKAETLNCIKFVKYLFDKADWIINATDPDREGELIFSYVYEVCKCTKPYKRVWFDDLVDEKMRYAFAHLKSPTEQLSPQEKGNAENLQLAGRARDIADWLIGTNITVAFTKKFGGYKNLLSIGRVQTPTLALVVKREQDIRNHVKQSFWKLSAVFSAETEFTAEYANGNFKDENTANEVLKQCQNQNGIVSSIETKRKTQSAPLLYNTTQLQIAANKKFGWNTDKTEKIMQSLYEKKIMSYPRTSTEHLTVAMQSEVLTTINKIFNLEEYKQYKPNGEFAKFTSRHFDDEKVGSHTAVIPTIAVPENLNDLSEDEKLIYDLLVKSLIRIVHPKAEYDDTTVIIDVGSHKFKTSGRMTVNAGWTSVDALPEEKNPLPPLTQNQTLPAKYNLKKGETEPPKRYTQATLLETMELAGQKLEDEQARTLMKLQKKGLGTDATRSRIVKSLFEREYLALKGKSIIPTEKGEFIINSLPPEAAEIKSAEMTGEMEKVLNDIALGNYDYNAFISAIKNKTSSWYQAIVNSDGKEFVSENEKKMICPLCGKSVGSYNWGYGCTGYKDGCKFSFKNNICGKQITEAQAIALCQKGKTSLIKGFTGKTGKTFDAYLVLDRTQNQIVFEFPKKISKNT